MPAFKRTFKQMTVDSWQLTDDRVGRGGCVVIVVCVCAHNKKKQMRIRPLERQIQRVSFIVVDFFAFFTIIKKAPGNFWGFLWIYSQDKSLEWFLKKTGGVYVLSRNCISVLGYIYSLQYKLVLELNSHFIYNTNLPIFFLF